MSDTILRIEKMVNGYEVEVRDPKIAAENAKPKSSWQDPMKGYAFNTAAEAGAFVTAVLDKLSPLSDDDEYAAAFKAATKDEK
jgi:hypothetical protein